MPRVRPDAYLLLLIACCSEDIHPPPLYPLDSVYKEGFPDNQSIRIRI